jgi:PHS family inorganic phosphate transporter-like MFS transporter
MEKTSQDVEKSPSPRVNKVHWSKLEEVEREGRPPFILTVSEIKLLGIVGVRLFLSFFVMF